MHLLAQGSRLAMVAIAPGWSARYHAMIGNRHFDAKSLSGPQIRAARALLGISADELAVLAEVGVATIRRAEAIEGVVSLTKTNAQRIVLALGAAGVVFIPRGDGGEGVRLAR